MRSSNSSSSAAGGDGSQRQELSSNATEEGGAPAPELLVGDDGPPLRERPAPPSRSAAAVGLEEIRGGVDLPRDPSAVGAGGDDERSAKKKKRDWNPGAVETIVDLDGPSPDHVEGLEGEAKKEAGVVAGAGSDPSSRNDEEIDSVVLPTRDEVEVEDVASLAINSGGAGSANEKSSRDEESQLVSSNSVLADPFHGTSGGNDGNETVPSVPLLEAQLVEEEPPAEVYDAIRVEEQGPKPWYKRYKNYMFVMVIVAMAIALGASLGAPDRNNNVSRNEGATITGGEAAGADDGTTSLTWETTFDFSPMPSMQISPRPSGEPSHQPTTTAQPSDRPLLHPRQCFLSRDELKTAVDGYITDESCSASGTTGDNTSK